MLYSSCIKQCKTSDYYGKLDRVQPLWQVKPICDLHDKCDWEEIQRAILTCPRLSCSCLDMQMTGSGSLPGC